METLALLIAVVGLPTQQIVEVAELNHALRRDGTEQVRQIILWRWLDEPEPGHRVTQWMIAESAETELWRVVSRR